MVSFHDTKIPGKNQLTGMPALRISMTGKELFLLAGSAGLGYTPGTKGRVNKLWTDFLPSIDSGQRRL